MSEVVKISDRGLVISLYKQKNLSKNWYGSFTWKGTRKRFSTKTDNLEKSKEFCYRVVDKLNNGGDEVEIKSKKVSQYLMTFEELFKSFLKYKKNTKSCQSKTLQNYKKWGKPLLDFCGHWIVEDEFPKYQSDLYGRYLEYRNTHRDEYQYFKRGDTEYRGRKLSKTLSGTTLNGEFTILHMVLSYGKHNLGLFGNWSIPSPQHHRLPENDEVTCPTQNEYVEMKNYWKERNRPEIVGWMRLCSNTGMRPSEMKSLKIDDIDLVNNILHIRNRKKQRRRGTKPLNTQFPITDRLKPILIEILELTKEIRKKSKSRYLFLNLKTGEPLGSFNKSWSKMLDTLDLDKRYSPKTLRKYFITKMVKESSIPLSVIADLVGHTNTNTLQKHYLELRTRKN